MDAVVYRMLLHHLDDISSALHETARVLRPEGMLVILDGLRLADANFQPMNRQLCRQGLPEEIQPGFATDELAATIGKLGFSAQQTFDGGEATFATPPYTDKVYGTRPSCW